MPETRSIPGNAGTLPEGPPREPIGPGGAQAAKAVSELAPAIDVANKQREQLKKDYPNLLDVRAGYKFRNGRITDTPAVVFVVTNKIKDVPPEQQLPPVLEGIVTDVTPADPFERLRNAPSRREAAPALRKEPRLLIDELQRPPGGEAAAAPIRGTRAPDHIHAAAGRRSQ
jgi:hypothetical protein